MKNSPKCDCPDCGQEIVVPEDIQDREVLCGNCGRSFKVDATAGKQGMSDRETYNLISDVATGVNVRWKDNLIQLAAIIVCLILGSLIGLLAVRSDRVMGAVVGGFIGLLVGLFGSGLFLMIYRFIQHMRGRHD